MSVDLNAEAMKLQQEHYELGRKCARLEAERDRLRSQNNVQRLSLLTLNLLMGQTIDFAESVLTEHDPEAVDNPEAKAMLASIRAQMQEFQATLANEGKS